MGTGCCSIRNTLVSAVTFAIRSTNSYTDGGLVGWQKLLQRARSRPGRISKRRWHAESVSLAWQHPDFATTPEVATDEHKESYSGKRAVGHVHEKEKRLGVSITLDGMADPENLALLTGAAVETVDADTDVAVSIAPAAVGDIISLEHLGVSNLALADSTGTPVDLVDR